MIFNGGNEGSIDLAVTGGTSPYVYSWWNSGTALTETNLAAGDDTATVTDVNGCTLVTSFTLVETSAIITNVAGTMPTCNVDADAITTVLAAGGTPSYSYV